MARFLLPEDDDSIREICAHLIAQTGHVLDEAPDGTEAVERVRALEYDAIITDGQMPPGLDGPTFLSEVRGLIEERVPSALKSGYSREALVRWGSPVGVRWFLPKGDFDSNEFMATCTEMLATRVRWLLAAQSDAGLPLRRDGRWAEIEMMEERFPSTEAAIRVDPRLPPARRVLHAPSPRAAVDCLAKSVRDWGSILYSRGDMNFGTPPQGSAARSRDWEQVDRHVRLEDEAIRRAAANASEPLRTRIHLALCCARFGWRWRVDEDVDLIVDPPVEVHEEGGVLHSETGPALRYRDGWELHALHGVRVPRHVIEAPEKITIEEIRRERHVELRRTLRERYGEERYFSNADLVLLDVDTVPIDALAPNAGSITRALVVDFLQKRFLVASDGSTRRVYHMEVPSDCDTCEQAYVALSGRPNARTIVQA